MKKNSFHNAPSSARAGAGALFVLIVAVYWPVFRSEFVWDDNSMLTENPFVQAGDGLRHLWFSTGPVDYFPLTYTSFWLEWRLWGMNATGYHVTNVLLHAVSTIFLWRIFGRLNLPGAWWAALVFGIHPVAVESVAWIAERKNTLCLFFYLSSVLFFLRSENPATAAQTSKIKTHQLDYVLSVIFFLLALLSKTAVVTFPVALLLYFWWKSTSHNHSPTFPFARRDLLRAAPFFVLSLILGLVTMWFQHHRAIAEEVIREAGFWTRFGSAGWAIWFYLFKAVLPFQLSFVYPEWNPTHRALWSALAWLALVFCGAWFWRKRQKSGRHLLFALGYFVLLLLPILGFLNIYFHRYSLVADHWQYFSLPGIIALLVGGAVHFLKTRVGLQRRGFQAAGVCAVIWLGFAASQHAMIFKNSETLWRDTLQKNPNAWLALNNLGLIYEDRGNLDQAAALFEKSLRINPRQTESRNNLGSVWLSQGKLDDAMAQYQAAFKLNPNFPTTRYNIANVLDRQGNTAEAMAEYREALRLNPGYVDAHNNLGCILILHGQIEEGMAHLREALRFKPDNLDSLNNLGRTLITHGRPREAIPFLTRALQINGASLNALFNFGDALLALGNSADALPFFSSALKIDPTSAPLHYKTGAALLQLGRTNEAYTHYSRAVHLNSNLVEAHYQLAVILSARKDAAAAISHFDVVIKLRPDWVEALNNLAWILATTPEETLRDGKRAVELAQRACNLTDNKNPGALDTLAAAYAQSGDFDRATQTADLAVTLMLNSGNATVVEPLRGRLELYRAGKVFRE